MRCKWENSFYKLYMMVHKEFVETMIKANKGTLSKGLVEKDTRTEFGIEFVGK